MRRQTARPRRAADYTATSGTLSFSPGATTRSINVTVLGDTRDEANETFAVNLSSPVNAAIATAQGIGTIVDNDAAPSIDISNVSVTEGNTGTKTASFAVTLSAVSGQTVTVNYATANGTATAGSDYVAAASTLTFAPGVTSQPSGGDGERRCPERGGRDRAREPEQRDQRQHCRLTSHTHHHQ